MAHYLVRAEPEWDRLEELAERLDEGEVEKMKPFGKTLHHSLTNARYAGEEAVWEEEDYCRPALKEERKAVLDDYFTNIRVEEVQQGEGWESIKDLPSMWDADELNEQGE